MSVEKYLHDNAKIKVYDNIKDKDRIFTLSVKDHWGFIGDGKDNTLTEMSLPQDKLSITNLKHIFNGEFYPVKYNEDSKWTSYLDASNREHKWIKQKDGTYSEEVRDYDISNRYQLLDVLENDKSILPQSYNHFKQEPEVNKPAYLVNDDTNEISGPIIPTTKKAVNNLKKAVQNNDIDLTVSKDSELKFAGNVPTGSLINGSNLELNKGANANLVKLDHSSIICNKGQIVNSTFKDSKSYFEDQSNSSPAYKPESYIFNSNLDHVHLIEGNNINSSIIDYAVLNKSKIKDSSLKGGNYSDSIVDHGYTWLLPDSLISASKLKNTRIEDRRISLKNYEEKADKLATSIYDIYSNDQKDAPTTMINSSDLDNVQILSNEHVGSTISNSTLKNTFVKEWIVSDKSKLVAKRPTRPLLIGRVSLDKNDLQFTNATVCFNLDEYMSKPASEGLELPKGASYDDTNIGSYDRAIQITPNHHDVKKLTKLEHGHYVLNNGDDAFSNLDDILQIDGGERLAIKNTAQKQNTAAKSKQQDNSLDGPEP